MSNVPGNDNALFIFNFPSNVALSKIVRSQPSGILFPVPATAFSNSPVVPTNVFPLIGPSDDRSCIACIFARFVI